MGFRDFWREVFSGDVDARIKAARRGIRPDAVNGEEGSEKVPYDPWEEVRNARMNFFLGSWARRKFRIVGEEKVKRELAELERKREEEEKGKKGEGSS